MEKTKKTYNEQLNERGDAVFIMKKNITKDKKIKKAFVYIPDYCDNPDDEKWDKVVDFLDKKGMGGCDDLSFVCGGFVAIADDKVLLVASPKRRKIYRADFTGLTGRGLRLNEKYIEGAIDYLEKYHQIENPDIVINEYLTPKADCFKKATADLSIDDLMDL